MKGKGRKRSDRQLVLQHLEHVSWRVLEECPEAVNRLIRRKHGVYALYRRDRLYYVGLATNLMGRLKSHLKDRHHGSWDRFSVYLTVHDDHIKEMESLILRIAEPVGNKQSGKFADSTNMMASLNQLMSEADADRRARLLGGVVARRRRRNKTRRTKGTIVLAGAIERSIQLRAEYKGNTYRATLRRDGTIRYSGEVFESPTAAARRVSGRARNGWNFWSYRNARREWVPLAHLRK